MHAVQFGIIQNASNYANGVNKGKIILFPFVEIVFVSAIFKMLRSLVILCIEQL